VRICSVVDQDQIASLPGHVQGVRTTEFSLDGATLATADGRGEIRLWSVDEFEMIRRWSASAQSDPVWDLAFSTAGLLASVDSSEDLRVWDPASGTQVGRTISGLGTNGATGAAFAEDAATVAVLTRNGELLLVDWELGVSLTEAPILAHPGGQAFGLAMDDSGTIFATAGADGVVRVWDLLSTDAACALTESRLNAESDRDVLGGSDPEGCV
jgi:WD40 repeat protein